MPLDFFGPLGIGHNRFLPMLSPDGDGGSGSEIPPSGDGDQKPGEGDPAGDKDTDDKGGDKLGETLEKERQLRKDAEKANRDLARKLKQFEDADKSEVQKLTGERDALQKRSDKALARAREAASRGVVEKAATDAGAIEAGAIFDLVQSQLAYEDGDSADDDLDVTPTNVAALIEMAKGKYPTLFRESEGGTDAGRQGSGGRSATLSANEQLRRQLQGR